MKQLWFCEACGTVGLAEMSNSAVAMEGAFAVIDSHREKSPSCDVNPLAVRVINFEHILEGYVPKWAATEVTKLLLESDTLRMLGLR